MILFIRLLLLSMIGLYLPCNLSAEESGKVRQPAPEWQIQGALAAWHDAIPEVKVRGLGELLEIGAVT
ncbi:MAG: hypothetical protein BWK79_19900 [Beggiatoa sp. IS2]|nr:MAG: hypothetical protein BWK79_19900 [Beggiatoa sp. IS2]